MKPLDEETVKQVLERVFGKINDEGLDFAVKISNGSPGIASDVFVNDGLEIYDKLLSVLKTTPKFSLANLNGFIEAVSAKDNISNWHLGLYFLGDIISKAVKSTVEPIEMSEEESLAINAVLAKNNPYELAQILDKISEIYRETDIFNMDRKIAMTNILNMLKQAA